MRILLALALLSSCTPALAATGDPVPAYAGTTLLFGEEFGPETTIADLRKRWRPCLSHYVCSNPLVRFHSGTGEQQGSFDPDYLGSGIEPLEIRDGILVMKDAPLPADVKAKWDAEVDKFVGYNQRDIAAAQAKIAAGEKNVTVPAAIPAKQIANAKAVIQSAGLLNSFKTFKLPMRIEYRFRMPTAGGRWPGVLYFFDHIMAPYAPIEGDIVEYVGDGTDGKVTGPKAGYCLHGTEHYGATPVTDRICLPTKVAGVWHTVVFDWRADNHLLTYIDGKQVRDRIASMGFSYVQKTYNFSLLAAMSINGGWTRQVGNAFTLGTSAEMELDYIRVSQLPSAYVAPPPVEPVVTPPVVVPPVVVPPPPACVTVPAFKILVCPEGVR